MLDKGQVHRAEERMGVAMIDDRQLGIPAERERLSQDITKPAGGEGLGGAGDIVEGMR